MASVNQNVFDQKPKLSPMKAPVLPAILISFEYQQMDEDLTTGLTS